VCPQNGNQTRTIISSFPAGCTGGSPVLTQNCTPAATTATILFNNNTAAYVAEVDLVPTGSSNWGNALNTAPIPPGGTFLIYNLAPGTYSGRAVIRDSVSPYFAYMNGVTVVAGDGLTVTASPSDYTGSISVLNRNSVYNLTEIEVASTSATTWGANQLPVPMLPGYYWVIDGVPAGQWGVRCVMANGAASTGAYNVPPLTTVNIYCQ
jgi:hypothetical protein